MVKLLILIIILISHNIYAQYDSKDENRIIDTSDQIIILYNLAKKNIEDKEFKKSLKLLKPFQEEMIWEIMKLKYLIYLVIVIEK